MVVSHLFERVWLLDLLFGYFKALRQGKRKRLLLSLINKRQKKEKMKEISELKKKKAASIVRTAEGCRDSGNSAAFVTRTEETHF